MNQHIGPPRNAPQYKNQYNKNAGSRHCSICFSTRSNVHSPNPVIKCAICNKFAHLKCYGINPIGKGYFTEFICQHCDFLVNKILSPHQRVDSRAPKPNNDPEMLHIVKPLSVKFLIERYKPLKGQNYMPECQICRTTSKHLLMSKLLLHDYFVHTICANLLKETKQIITHYIQEKNSFMFTLLPYNQSSNPLKNCSVCQTPSNEGFLVKCAFGKCSAYFHIKCLNFEKSKRFVPISHRLTSKEKLLIFCKRHSTPENEGKEDYTKFDHIWWIKKNDRKEYKEYFHLERSNNFSHQKEACNIMWGNFNKNYTLNRSLEVKKLELAEKNARKVIQVEITKNNKTIILFHNGRSILNWFSRNSIKSTIDGIIKAITPEKVKKRKILLETIKVQKEKNLSLNWEQYDTKQLEKFVETTFYTIKNDPKNKFGSNKANNLSPEQIKINLLNSSLEFLNSKSDLNKTKENTIRLEYEGNTLKPSNKNLITILNNLSLLNKVNLENLQNKLLAYYKKSFLLTKLTFEPVLTLENNNKDVNLEILKQYSQAAFTAKNSIKAKLKSYKIQRSRVYNQIKQLKLNPKTTNSQLLKINETSSLNINNSIKEEEEEAEPNKSGQNLERVLCCICLQEDFSDENQIVFCDFCNIPVHQSCYGVDMLPPGPWHCSRCYYYLFVNPSKVFDDNLNCIICGDGKGALKPTFLKGVWCHSICAYWTPEIYVGSPCTLEPVLGFTSRNNVEKYNKCFICNKTGLRAIQCNGEGCYKYMHVSCGQATGGLLLETSRNARLDYEQYCHECSLKLQRTRKDIEEFQQKISVKDLKELLPKNCEVFSNLTIDKLKDKSILNFLNLQIINIPLPNSDKCSLCDYKLAKEVVSCITCNVKVHLPCYGEESLYHDTFRIKNQEQEIQNLEKKNKEFTWQCHECLLSSKKARNDYWNLFMSMVREKQRNLEANKAIESKEKEEKEEENKIKKVKKTESNQHVKDSKELENKENTNNDEKINKEETKNDENRKTSIQPLSTNFTPANIQESTKTANPQKRAKTTTSPPSTTTKPPKTRSYSPPTPLPEFNLPEPIYHNQTLQFYHSRNSLNVCEMCGMSGGIMAPISMTRYSQWIHIICANSTRNITKALDDATGRYLFVKPNPALTVNEFGKTVKNLNYVKTPCAFCFRVNDFILEGCVTSSCPARLFHGTCALYDPRISSFKNSNCNTLVCQIHSSYFFDYYPQVYKEAFIKSNKDFKHLESVKCVICKNYGVQGMRECIKCNVTVHTDCLYLDDRLKTQHYVATWVCDVCSQIKEEDPDDDSSKQIKNKLILKNEQVEPKCFYCELSTPLLVRMDSFNKIFAHPICYKVNITKLLTNNIQIKFNYNDGKCVDCEESKGVKVKCNEKDCDIFGHLICSLNKSKSSFKIIENNLLKEDNFIQKIARKEDRYTNLLRMKSLPSIEKMKFTNTKYFFYCKKHLDNPTSKSTLVIGLECEICSFGEIDPENKIIHCYKCDNGYHTNCYGFNGNIEKKWVCDGCSLLKLEINKENKNQCVLCEENYEEIKEKGGILRVIKGDNKNVKVCDYCFRTKEVLNVNILDYMKLTLGGKECSYCNTTDKSPIFGCDVEIVNKNAESILLKNKKCREFIHFKCEKKRFFEANKLEIKNSILERNTIDFDYCCEKHRDIVTLHCICKSHIEEDEVEEFKAVQCNECLNKFHLICGGVNSNDIAIVKTSHGYLCVRCRLLSDT